MNLLTASEARLNVLKATPWELSETISMVMDDIEIASNYGYNHVNYSEYNYHGEVWNNLSSDKFKGLIGKLGFVYSLENDAIEISW